jgi:hypothetical protein
MLGRKSSPVPKYSPCNSKGNLGAKIDIGELIQKFSEFLTLSSPSFPRKLCKNIATITGAP